MLPSSERLEVSESTSINLSTGHCTVGGLRVEVKAGVHSGVLVRRCSGDKVDGQ